MPTPIPTAVLCLITGLVAGTTGGYFWGVDSQPAPSANAEQTRSEPAASNYGTHAASAVTGLSAAFQNPTGLRLVGTVVQPDHKKSKAWLLEVATSNTQAYAEGDSLPGGYRLITIGAEDLQVTKDGYTFSIRRSSSSSEVANAPCEALAQTASNSHGIPENRRHALPGQSAPKNPNFGIFDFSNKTRPSRDKQTAPAPSSPNGSQSSGSNIGGIGNTGGTGGTGGTPKPKSRNWGQQSTIAEDEEIRSTPGDALSTLPADDNP